MKRKLNMGIALVILLCSLAVPVSASEVSEDDLFFDVLTYTTANDSGSNVVTSVNNVTQASFLLPDSRQVKYVDIIIRLVVGSTAPTSVTIANSPTAGSPTALNVINIHDNVYRCYGFYSSYRSPFYITINCESSRGASFDSVRVCYQTIDGFDETGTCDIQAYGYSSTINYVPSDLINYRHFTGDSENNQYNLYITCGNWRKYDYIDFFFSLDVATLNTVIVNLGDSIIPADVSFIDNGSSLKDHFFVSVRIDLTDVNRLSTEGLIVHVTGNVDTGEVNFICMDGIRGYYRSGEVNPLYAFLRNIVTKLASIETALSGNTSSGDAFKDDSAGLISGLDELSASMDSVQRPSMDWIDTGFTADITDATTLMSGLFGEVTAVGWLSKILLASVVVALLAYVLYGKG